MLAGRKAVDARDADDALVGWIEGGNHRSDLFWPAGRIGHAVSAPAVRRIAFEQEICAICAYSKPEFGEGLLDAGIDFVSLHVDEARGNARECVLERCAPSEYEGARPQAHSQVKQQAE